MAKGNVLLFRPSRSLIISVILHIIFFALLFNTLSFESKKPPITVNLQRDPGTSKKIVQATLIDKRAADLAAQRQIAEEKLKRDKIIEQQRKVEQQQLEVEQAKQAALELAKQQKEKLELAKQAKEQKLKQEQQLQIKKQIATQQQQLRQQALEKQQAKQQAAKQQAAKQAALKSQYDRMLSDQQALLESEVERYRAEFAAAIEENRILSSIFSGEMSCKLRIMLLPDGSILSVKVLESSGNPAYDEISASAVYKSAPFMMPEDQELYAQLREIVLSFKNGE